VTSNTTSESSVDPDTVRSDSPRNGPRGRGGRSAASPSGGDPPEHLLSRASPSDGGSHRPTTPDDQHRLLLETRFRGVVLLLVVGAVVLYPLYALIFNISGQNLSVVIAPVTGIAGAVVGYWFGQASRNLPGS
jgi:hypothetical protein